MQFAVPKFENFHLVDVSSVTLGSDTEWFLKDKQGSVLSVEGRVGGTKHYPRPILEEVKPGFAVQEDNVMFEFNIPVCKTEDDMVQAFDQIKTWAKENIKELDIFINASAELDPMELATEQALTFGCEPDFNAWLDEENPPPDRRWPNMRTAGGHIHIGYNNPNMDMNNHLVRFLDLYLGVPSIILDSDTKRRFMYGKAGACRHKPYGLEYRVLSNFWTDNEMFIRWTYKNVMRAIEAYNSGFDILSHGQRITDCINNQDMEEAKKLIEEFHLLGEA